MAMPRHPTPGMPPFYGEHPSVYNPMMQPPQVEKPLGPMPPQMHVPQVRLAEFEKNQENLRALQNIFVILIEPHKCLPPSPCPPAPLPPSQSCLN